METVTETPIQLPEQAPKRTLEDVKREYAQHCAHAGELQYKKAVIDHQLAMTNQKISQFNDEAEKLTKEGAQSGQA